MARKAAAKKKAASKPYVITTLFDRPHVRITHTVMHPNAVIPKHTHDQDYTIYPLTDLDASNRIEAIRVAYKQAFQQESVLRVDSRAGVSF